MALVESAALAAGLKVARFTSPHLNRYNERFVIDRQPIDDEALAGLIQEIYPVVEEAKKRPEFGAPTEFEVGTVLAFLYFARSKVDLAIIEVGMGGRLDSTNVLKPLAVGLTHIDLDHVEVLGPDLVSIAREKAGIIKERTPVVTATAYPEVRQVLAQRAKACQAPFYSVGETIRHEISTWDEKGVQLNLAWKEEPFEAFHVNLLGAHQAQNAAVAFGLLKVLEKRGFSAITHDAIRQGFSSAVWPGRLEYIPGEPDILLDGAHNPDGFRSLAAAIRHIYPGKSVIALLGILENRPIDAMAEILSDVLSAAITTNVPDPKGQTAERTRLALELHGVPSLLYPDPIEALRIARERAIEEKALLLVAGSLYLVGHLRSTLFQRG